MKRPKERPDAAGQPHDALIHKTFSQPALAAAELQAILPPEIVRQIRWDTLALIPGTYVDHRLRHRYTDLLYKARLHRGGAGLLYVLFEHQSTVDPLMAMRLLGYEANIWNKWIAEHPKAKKLPAIFPVVLYHGTSRWTPAREFLSLIALPPELLEHWRRYLPSFEYLMESLPEESDEVLRARPMPATVKMVVLVLKHARKGRRVLEHLREWQALVQEMTTEPWGLDVLVCLLEYIFQVGNVEPEEVGACVGRTPAVQEAIMTTAQRLIEQGWKEGLLAGRQEGLLAGRQEGLLEGQRELLLELFQARFGAVSRRTMARIKGASAEQLARWGKRLITAKSAEAVWAD